MALCRSGTATVRLQRVDKLLGRIAEESSRSLFAPADILTLKGDLPPCQSVALANDAEGIKQEVAAGVKHSAVFIDANKMPLATRVKDLMDDPAWLHLPEVTRQAAIALQPVAKVMEQTPRDFPAILPSLEAQQINTIKRIKSLLVPIKGYMRPMEYIDDLEVHGVLAYRGTRIDGGTDTHMVQRTEDRVDVLLVIASAPQVANTPDFRQMWRTGLPVGINTWDGDTFQVVDKPLVRAAAWVLGVPHADLLEWRPHREVVEGGGKGSPLVMLGSELDRPPGEAPISNIIIIGDHQQYVRDMGYNRLYCGRRTSQYAAVAIVNMDTGHPELFQFGCPYMFARLPLVFPEDDEAAASQAASEFTPGAAVDEPTPHARGRLPLSPSSCTGLEVGTSPGYAPSAQERDRRRALHVSETSPYVKIASARALTEVATVRLLVEAALSKLAAYGHTQLVLDALERALERAGVAWTEAPDMTLGGLIQVMEGRLLQRCLRAVDAAIMRQAPGALRDWWKDLVTRWVRLLLRTALTDMSPLTPGGQLEGCITPLPAVRPGASAASSQGTAAAPEAGAPSPAAAAAAASSEAAGGDSPSPSPPPAAAAAADPETPGTPAAAGGGVTEANNDSSSTPAAHVSVPPLVADGAAVAAWHTAQAVASAHSVEEAVRRFSAYVAGSGDDTVRRKAPVTLRVFWPLYVKYFDQLAGSGGGAETLRGCAGKVLEAVRVGMGGEDSAAWAFMRTLHEGEVAAAVTGVQQYTVMGQRDKWALMELKEELLSRDETGALKWVLPAPQAGNGDDGNSEAASQSQDDVDEGDAQQGNSSDFE